MWPMALTIVRPVVRFWIGSLARSAFSRSKPTGDPQVHAEGADADRLLLIADGASVGHGLLSHELGLAGHLARTLSAGTGRGVDIDIIAHGNMNAAASLDALRSVELSRFDALVLTIGSHEAIGLVPLAQWRHDLTNLLDYINANAPSSLHTFVIAVPPTRASIDFPRILSSIVDRQVDLLNATTRVVHGGRAGVTIIPFGPEASSSTGRNSSLAYEKWAKLIAPAIADELSSGGWSTRGVQNADEPARQQSLVSLSILDTAPEERIDTIVRLATTLLDTTGAAVTFIDNDRQWIKSAVGIGILDSPRVGAFSDMTIRRAELFVVENARIDSRFSSNHSVTGEDQIQFYAGYPLEAPDGRRVGALCVLDTAPRSFSKQDAALLRNLALRVQKEVWAGGR